MPAIDRHTVLAVVPPGAKAVPRKEKLHFHAHIWYKVSRSERVSYNGITPASQADNEGSIPFTRSTIFKACSCVHPLPHPAGGRIGGRLMKSVASSRKA